MNRTALRALVTSALLAVLGGAAEAGTLRLQWNSSQYEASPGGEFQVTTIVPSAGDLPIAAQLSPANVGGPGTFQTFCVEYNEYLASSGSPYNYTITDGASNGGRSGQVPVGGTYDPLDARTAYLYHNFWFGTLTDYRWTPLDAANRVTSARSLQRAIWFLEGEADATFDTLGELQTYDSQAFAWVADANAKIASGAWVGLGDVRVLHLTKMDGSASQDQLVVVVPLPPAVWGGLALLGGLGVFRARRRRRLADLA